MPAITAAASRRLPANILSYRIKITGVGEAVSKHGKMMDGMFFGYVGADAVVGLIPIFGSIITGLTTIWLLGKASEVKMPFGDRALIAGFGVADGVIGAIPALGQAAELFFRGHAWNSERIQHHVAGQLAQIEAIENELLQPLPEEHHAKAIQQLEDSIFRGGKTQKEVWVRLGLIATACVALLGYCSYQVEQRQTRIEACKGRGEWLCGWRN